MKRFLTRSPLSLRGLMVIVVALTISLWMSCGDDYQAPVSPQESQESIELEYGPEVQAVMAIQNRNTDNMLKIKGVVGTATTILPDGRAAVKILTEDAQVHKRLPKILDGVPVVAEAVGIIRALSFTGKYTPVPAGVSMGNRNECSAGTNGCVVQKSNGTKYFLSNNHVFARQNAAAIGEDIVQPGLFDSQPQCDPNFPNHVADLSSFVRIRFGFASNRVDAAIAQIRSGVSFTCGTICGYTPSNTTATATVGMAVKKCGRTTELTTGTVTGINVTVFVQYNGGIARFVSQIQFSNISSPGDSGSLIVTNDGTNRPVALLFAGSSSSTIGNRINDVLSAFSVTICNN